MNDDTATLADEPAHMRAEYPQRAKDPEDRAPTERNLRVFAKDLTLGRGMAAAALGIDIKTVRNQSMIVRAYYGATTNTQAAYVMGWLKIPKKYE